MNRARNQKTETPTVNDKFFEDLLVALDNDPTGQAPTLRLNTKLKSPPSKLPSKYEQSENGDIGSRYNMSELDSPQVSCASESTASEDRKTRRARIRRDLEPSPSPIFSAALTLQEETDRNTNRNSKQQYSPTLSNQTSLGVLELANIKIGTLFSTAKLSDKLAGQDFNFMDDSQTQQLISQALLDIEEFPILSPASYSMRKKDLIQISNTFESCQNEIALQVAEIKSIENSMTQIREYRLQMKASEDKVKKLSKDLWNYTKLLIYCERDVLKHLAGVMKIRPTTPKSNSSMAGKNELSETETRLAELESYAKSLENTIFRLESEQKPLQKLALESQKTAKQAIDECNAIKSIAHDDGPVNKLDYNRLRLDHAKTKSQLADTILELDTKKEMLSELQLQLKRDQDVIQNKDRLISNLLADLEQLQSALDIQQMGGTAQPEQTSMASLGRMLGKGRMMDSNEDSKRLEIMTIQLEEAIYEREKFKLMVQQEKDRTTSKAQFTDLPTSDASSVNDNSTVAPNSDLQSLFHDMNSLIGKEGERYSEQALFNSGTIVLQKVEKLRTKLKSKYSDLNTLKAQLVALSKGFKEKDADLLQQSTHISELEASKSKLQHEILAIEEEHHLELKEMEIEKAKLKSEIQELRDAEALAHKQVLDLKAEFGVKLQDLGDKASMERKKVHQIQAESDLALEQTKKDTNSKINNLLSQITELQGHLSHKSQALSQLSKDAVEQEAKSKEMTAKLEQQVKSLMVQLDQVNLHHNALIQKTADSELQIQSRLKEKDSEISSMGIRVRELESTIQKRDIDHKAIEASLIKATSDYQSLKHELDRLQLDAAAQANKSKDELFEANRKFNSLNRKFKDTQNDAELYKNQCDILEAEVMISKREIKIPTTSADTSPLEMKIKEKDEELTQAHAKIESMLQDLEAKEQELQDLARDGDETLEELERLQNMLFDVKSSRADLLEKLDDYQIEIEELKRQLK